MIKVGFIGAGNMGSALCSAATKATGVTVYIYDKDTSKAKDVAAKTGAIYAENSVIASDCDFIFLAVKPNVVYDAVKEFRSFFKNDGRRTVVSMAAGVSIEQIENYFPANPPPIIRIMPNTPASIGKGMILYCKNEKVTETEEANFLNVMEGAGKLDYFSEKLIDAGTAISGCGPAFVYMFVEALADGGVQCGLPRDKALTLAAETLIGAASMISSGKGHPEELKDAVCSPGGSTIAGVHALEEGAFRATASNAVISAYKRTVELGK